ncbi:Bug family tripartite tricarboxylate transporter substrate binding protein [Noviherbaspirillum malthae]|uniref:Bug family tripartite tricarboxylate transporter substrate binding protein n=1 Tax=Noviherbaspirillum malthae TaxID=1260987 RepID=UPI00188F7BC9|nr:tripartite tricarboxylate transporter substrate binding protein [Noviherbaspirillum malthae]
MAKTNPAAMDMSRRSFLKLTAAGVAGLAGAMPGSAAWASEWPSKTIRFISQSGAGDAVDLRLRDFVTDLGPALKNVPCIVENKPGAGGIIAAQSMVNSDADGNTIFLGNAAMTILPNYHKKLPFLPIRDFAPIALSGQAPTALAISAKRPEKTLDEWLASMKKRQDIPIYGSTGSGTPGHLYGYQVSEDFGFKAEHAPYRGNVPALMDLVAGRFDFVVLDIFSLRPFYAKGELRILAVAANERSKFLPEVPTFAELGHKGYDRMGWTAYFVKNGTSPAIIKHLADAMNTANNTPKWHDRRRQLWSEWQLLSPADIQKRLQRETEAWGALMKRGNIQA